MLRHCRANLAVPAFVVVLAATTVPPASAADYGFQVRYSISLSALPVGEADLVGQFTGRQYRLVGEGRLTGIAELVAEYRGNVRVDGSLGDRVEPTSLHAEASDGKSTDTIRITMSNNEVRRVRFDPPWEEHRENHPARVALTADHQRGVVDPVSALIAPGGYAGGTFNRAVCERTVPVFAGTERFDLVLEFNGIRTVSGGRRGYSGPVMACTARYRPVAGHRTDRDAVRYMQDRTIEVLLAPVADSDLLVPYRASVPTPLGAATIQATRIYTGGTLETRHTALPGQ